LLLLVLWCITSYAVTTCRDIILHKHTGRTPWPRFQNMLKKELSLVGEGTTDVIAEKTITVKQCCIGANCKIGVMAKLNNCVIMDNVTIGDK
jgi:translation initiation factor eIF-2B subunit gamma